MTFLLDASVSRYGRPLKIRDFVWRIQCWDLRTLNNVKSNFSFNEVSKKKLPAIHSTVFRCLLVVKLFFFFFLPYCITTVTPFIRRSLKRSKISVFYFANKVSYFQRSPVTRHRRVQQKGHASPMASKLLYILSSWHEFGLPVVLLYFWGEYGGIWR